MQRKILSTALFAAALLTLAACGGAPAVIATQDGGNEGLGDGGVDAGTDAGVVAGIDAGGDAETDAGVDAGFDAGIDAGTVAEGDAGFDAGIDAGTDAGVDAGTDAGVDEKTDAGVDAGFDAGVDAGVDAGSDADAGADAGTDAADAGEDDAGADAGDGGALAVQMNDVSILYPLASDGGVESIALVPASASGAQGVLLSEEVYNALGHITGSTVPDGGTAPGEAEYGDLYVVGVRIDPCFASTAPAPDGTGCLNQLRLVMQEVKLVNGSLQAFDSGLHVFYSLTREQLEDFARGVIALREASSGQTRLGSLQPHPLMVSQGLSGSFASGLQALILEYAGAQTLTRVTEMNTNGNFGWNFFGYDLTVTAQETTSQPMIIPTLANSATAQQFQRNAGANPNMNGAFTPETTCSDDLALLANANAAAQATSTARQTAFNSLVAVENPTMLTPNTIDCASCHLAMPTEVFNAAPAYGFSETGNSNTYLADSRFCLADELSPTLDPNAAFNVHAFSYVGESAAINQRVVNETAAIVAYLNTLPSN